MRHALAGLRGHLGRLVATTLAVVFGIAFVAGTLIFADTTRAGYARAFSSVAAHVDVSVQPATGTLLTEEELARVRRVAGVAAASGRMQAPLALLDRTGAAVTNFGLVGTVIATDGEADLLPFTVTGRLPEAGADEALLDTQTAQRLGDATGDTVTVIDETGDRHLLRLVGLLDFGVYQPYPEQSVVGLPGATITAFTGVTGYTEIVARGGPGVAPADLATAVGRQLDPSSGARVQTGAQRRQEILHSEASWVDAFRLFLLLFAAVSLIVAGFVITNTFAVLGALRMRQLALLRCVGATRGQLFGATLVESALVGLVGGVVGVLAGVGVAYGLVTLLNGQIGVGVPVGAPVVGPAAVVAGLVLGVGVTVVAAFVPALRATRVPALAALREAALDAVTRRPVLRGVLAGLVGLVGAGLTALGARESDIDTGVVLIVAGGVVAFLGVLLGAPLFVGPLASLLGTLPGRLWGTPARLATANTRRNPGRTAITAATLMVGVGLMSVFSVVFASTGASAGRQLTEQYPVDFFVTGLSYGGDEPVLPAGFADALAARPEFGGVARVRVVQASVAGQPVRIGAIDTAPSHAQVRGGADPAALGTLLAPPVTAGSLTDLRPGTVVVATNRSAFGTTPIGGTLAVTGPAATASLRVVAQAPSLVPVAGDLDLLVAWPDLAALAGDTPDSAVLAKVAPGVPRATARTALDALSREYPLVRVSSVAGLVDELESTVDSVLAVVAALLVVTVLISLFGIANTLALSVVERTRESATLRALGLTRGQLRGTLLIESVLMAMIGALVGLSLGLVYGAILAHKALAALQPVVAVPWAWFLGIVAITTVTAILAAVLPARRAGRSSLVDAMAQT